MSTSRITVLMGVLALCIMSGCASVRGDWERSRRLDTSDAYAGFLESHPVGVYSDSARVRIDALEQARREVQERSEREEREAAEDRAKTLATDNARRMALLRSYQPSVTTEQAFLADGWTAGDLAKGRIGIIAKSTAGTTTQYTMAVVPIFVEDPAAAKLMEGLLGAQVYFATNGARSEYSMDIKQATKLCTLAFEQGVLGTTTWPAK